MSRILIIGAGYAGLMAGWQAAQRGHGVQVIAKGWGATHWLSGCIDILGYQPLDNPEPVASPAAEMAGLLAEHEEHPYALIGQKRLAAALEALSDLCAAQNYPLHGSLDKNWLLPSGAGTARPTCLAPATMIAGDMRSAEPMLIVGFKQFQDFHAKLIADNLSAYGIPAKDVTLDLPSLGARLFTTPTIFALLTEESAFQQELLAALRPHLGQAARIGFPAVLGMDQSTAVHAALEKALGRPVFEVPTLTPSVPGMRLQHILVRAIQAEGGRVTPGVEALDAKMQDGRVTTVYSETPARTMPHRYDLYVLATGGILGGGIVTDHAGHIRETIFNLPVTCPPDPLDWFRRDFMDNRGHPIYRSGIAVDDQFRPVNGGDVLYDNLFCVGTTLAHGEVIRERSFEGVALGSGYAAAQLF